MDQKLYLCVVVVLAGACTLVVSQQRSVPNTISSCYQNTTAYNRYTRQPMHIDNLVAIIRKIEEKTNAEWTSRRIARTILKQFQFDGLSYDPYKRPDYQFETDELEDHRTDIVFQSLAGQETLPDGLLDNDEKCALHWMLSHSINNTLRDDEVSRQFNLRAKRSLKNDSHETDGDNYDSLEFDLDVVEPVKETTPSPKFRRTSTTARVNNVDSDIIENLPSDDDYQADHEHYIPGNSKFERQAELPTTKAPIETGIVYTRWGSISAGKLIAGIAAGLEPVLTPIQVTSESAFRGVSGTNNNNGNTNVGNNGNSGTGNQNSRGSNNFNQWGSGGSQWAGSQSQQGRWKRQTGGGNDYLAPLSNIYAATLAGDVGQAAILNGVFTAPSSQSPPTGRFNDTICPREYIMDALSNPTADVSHSHDTWTYLTAAEIRGGVDGLILGLQIKVWDDKSTSLRLSNILEQYYSEMGVADDPRYRACNRGSVYQNTINPTEVLEQSKSFAYVYNNKTSKLKVSTTENINYIYTLVNEAYSKMSGYVSTMSSIDGGCVRREASGSLEIPEADKLVVPKTTVYAVLDPTDTDYDLIQQKRFVAQLAFELGVSPFGSRLGLVNGASGQIIIKPNFTDNPSILACNILSQRTPSQGQIGLVTTLNNLETEILRVKELEITNNFTDTNGIAILVLNEGKQFEETTRSEVRSKVKDFSNKFGDVHIIYATSKYQAIDYEEYAIDTEFDIIKIQNSGNLSNEASKFTQEFVKKQHSRLTYPRCNKNAYNQDDEHRIGTDLFISPNTIQYYKISPDYFFSAVNLQLRFSSQNGKVKICVSKSNRFPNSQNTGKGSGVDCYETSGQYQPVESSTADLEISYNKPCGGDGKRDGCKPIYLSITPISFPVAGSVGFDCNVDKCQYSNQVKVTFSHWDMRCNSNSAVHTVLSIPGLFAALLLSVVTLTRYS